MSYKSLHIIFGLAAAFIAGSFVFASFGSVNISAVVGSQNHSPIILSINPSDDPRLLKANKIQKYIIRFQDYEKDVTDYTITSSKGYISPANGQISTFDSSSGAYINFTYITPSSVPVGNLDKVTLTLSNSGATSTGIVTKDINIYVY